MTHNRLAQGISPGTSAGADQRTKHALLRFSAALSGGVLMLIVASLVMALIV